MSIRKRKGRREGFFWAAGKCMQSFAEAENSQWPGRVLQG